MPIGTVLGAAAILAAAGPTCSAHSMPARVAVVELYTSQGCSSCPPADRWLSQLPAHYGIEQALPLAFHVDYWDDLGWKDRFARPEFSRRQRALADRTGSATIYTPEVYVDGRELRSWSEARSTSSAIERANAKPAQARIDVTAVPDGAEVAVAATAQRTGGAGAIDLVLALTQSGQSTAVAAGENRGERLLDDHIVRDWQRERVAPGGELRRQLAIPADGPRQFTLVALAYDATSGELLQALGVPLDRCLAPAPR